MQQTILASILMLRSLTLLQKGICWTELFGKVRYDHHVAMKSLVGHGTRFAIEKPSSWVKNNVQKSVTVK